MDTRIYVMTHKQYSNPDGPEYDGLYHPLHVGHAISADLGYPGDDVGDNISSVNKSWCELTGIYWLWKNVTCDTIGICHYRRYFVADEDFLKKDYIEKALQTYDVIVSRSTCTEYSNLYEHYADQHIEKDMKLCREVLLSMHPEYENAFDLCMSCNLFTVGNMMICSKSLFDEYCSWLFGVLFEVEKKIDISGYDTFQARVMGYLSERLLRVWLLHNNYRVSEVEVRMIDPADKDNNLKEIDLKQKYVGLVLKDLISQYHVGNYAELVDSPPVYHDPESKIPVWVCWWQGESDMPELIRVCIDSLRRNIPGDLCRLHLVTMDNVGEYLSFPQWIIDRFESGAITMTGLSDILRMGLLYRYGGMWIDSTYYVASPIDRTLFEAEFYTQKFDEGKWKADVVQGRWAGNLIITKPGNVLCRFALNAFYMYWFKQEEAIDYYLIDYLIDAAYSNIDEVRNLIDSCKSSQPDCLELHKILDDPYDPAIYEKLTANTTFFKLYRKLSPAKETIIGKETFYGHISSVR